MNKTHILTFALILILLEGCGLKDDLYFPIEESQAAADEQVSGERNADEQDKEVKPDRPVEAAP